MGLHTQLPSDVTEVDVIIAGGGTAGCVVAARLAEADPTLSILVLEGGPDNQTPTITIPALYSANLNPSSKLNIFYTANKSKELGGRSPFVAAGGVLGGGSSTNLMMYCRAQRSDYDSWETPGWTANDLLPYLKKLETYHGPNSNDSHGNDGPLHISCGSYSSPRSQKEFIDAAVSLGWPEIEDLQTLDAINGTQRALRYISADGERQDTASRYLRPLLNDGKHHNLNVVLELQVLRVLFDNENRATGVEFSTNPAFQPEAEVHITQIIKANKLVVLSAGALGTPSILERSGVGNPEVLDRAGVPLVSNVPGVGHEYEDHHLLIYSYKTTLEPSETLDVVAQGREDLNDLIKNGDPRLGWNGMDIASKLRPNDADVAALGPAFQEAWGQEFKNAPDRPLVHLSGINAFTGDPKSVPPGQYYSISAFTPYPFSRGHVHITGPKISDPLDFEIGFFKNAIDVKSHIWAYKTQREIARRMGVYRGEVADAHPAFAVDSKARSVDLAGPLLLEAIKNIEYSVEDDAAIEKWVRENVSTTWHSLGTCKMKPLEENGVVDGSLSVHNVKGLKIVDLSIVPKNISGNTNNTAVAIGEKAADIFLKELGIRVG